MTTSYGQNGEDTFIERFFEGKTGLYVDVGAFDGKLFSNTFLLEQHGWHGICIEPNPPVHRELIKNRPGAICVNAACSDSIIPPFMDLHTPNNTPVLATVDKSTGDEMARILGIQPAQITWKSCKVPMKRLDDILIANGMQRGFALLSIDTEFWEHRVIAGINLRHWMPRMIMVETNNAQMKANIECALAKAWGNDEYGSYEFAGRIAVNSVYVHSIVDKERAQRLLR